jgi:hypothetical protein
MAWWSWRSEDTHSQCQHETAQVEDMHHRLEYGVEQKTVENEEADKAKFLQIEAVRLVCSCDVERRLKWSKSYTHRWREGLPKRH